MNYSSKTKDELIAEIELLKHQIKKNKQDHPLKKLPLSEEKFQILADQSPNMIFINLRGRIIFANTKCEEIMGYSLKELYADDFNFLSLIAPEFRDDVTVSFHNHLQGKEMETYECSLHTKDKKEISVIITTKLINVSGEIAILGIITDITERKLIELALEESESRYQKLLELSFDGSAIHQDGKIVFINQKGAQILGADKPDQILGENIFELLHPDFREVVTKRIENRNEMGASLLEEKFLKLDGKTVDVEVAGIPITYNGKSARQVIFRDISKRKLAEEQLRQSEELYKKLVDTLPDAVTVVDLEGNLTNVSSRALELFKYEDSDELIGKSGFILLKPEERELAQQNLRRTFESESFRGAEYNVLRKDGSQFIGEVNATILKDARNKPTGFITTIRDITERKKFEKALQESEANFRTLAENANDAIFIANTFGAIIYANKRASELTEYSNKKLLSLNVKDLTHPNEYVKVIKMLSGRTVDKSMPKQYETKIVSKTGITIPVELTAAKTLWLNQPVSVASLRDISFRKQAEAELFEYQKQLQSFASKLALSEEKERRKIANEIHDRLGQSLALSKIKISELQEITNSETISIALREIRGIIENLIDETRALTFELSPPILYELGFEPAIEWLAEQFQTRHNISIRIEDDGGKRKLDQDIRFILFDAVRELLINVVKHAKAKNVKISMKKENGFLRIKVNDDGIGFNVAILKPNQSRKQSFGYFQIKERLRMLNGELLVKSSPGKGTNVSIKAPMK